MERRLQKARNFTAGDRKVEEPEKIIKNIEFKIHKFTSRVKPTDVRNIVIFPMFSEFGCETLSVVYCLPKMLRQYFAGKYSIVMGWHGREYFYKHLVDEFWEIPEDCMWLREYCRAFHHVSRNLKRTEKEAAKYGTVVDVGHIGNIAVFPTLDKCPHDGCNGAPVFPFGENQRCAKCLTVFPGVGLFNRMEEAKAEAVWLPKPREEKIERAKKYLPSNAVGITARHRKTWGRNLDPIFYERLVYLLEDMGYNPVWMGEKVTSLPCPFKRLVDYSSTEDANDLETSLALVSQMKFTIQFWTASSRLAALMGTPYILFESPDQIWGVGQEGLRLNLITRGERKLVICHYKNVYNDNTAALKLAETSIRDIENNNFEDIIGMVENREYVQRWKDSQRSRVGEDLCKI